jgi:NADH:ubiquinone oxidoreductase subunit E
MIEGSTVRMPVQISPGFSIEESLRGLQSIYDKYKDMPGSTIPILQEIQEKFGYLPEDAVNWVADRLDVPRSTFYGVATFYSQFYLTPRGKNIVTVCCGTACHVKGSEKILSALHRELGLSDEKETTDDLNFTVEKVNCVGACSIAPVVIVNKTVNGKAVREKILRTVKGLTKKVHKDE